MANVLNEQPNQEDRAHPRMLSQPDATNLSREVEALGEVAERLQRLVERIERQTEETRLAQGPYPPGPEDHGVRFTWGGFEAQRPQPPVEGRMARLMGRGDIALPQGPAEASILMRELESVRETLRAVLQLQTENTRFAAQLDVTVKDMAQLLSRFQSVLADMSARIDEIRREL